MGIFDKRKNKEEQKLFEEYEKYEQHRFYIASEDKTTKIFKDGKLIIYTEEIGQKPAYTVITKDENGQMSVKQLSLEKRLNIEMRSEDLYLTVKEGKETNIYRVDEEDYFYKGDELKYVKEALGIILDFNETKKTYEKSKEFFANVIDGVKNGTIPVEIQAKCVCVDARLATPEEVGTKFTVWSHGKVEKVLDVKPDTVFITTLDENGKPVVDEAGHTNTYDMPLAKFKEKYQKHANGHYVQDPTPMATIKLGNDVIPEEGITILPPNWGGYEGTLMQGGLIMLPFNPTLSKEEQISVWESYLSDAPVDWYPNNEADTYAPCDRNGKFLDEKLQALYGQNIDKGKEQ